MAAFTDTLDLPDNNIQGQAIALILGFPVAATVALALRIYSRILTGTFASGKELIMKFSLDAMANVADDWFICFAGVSL